MVAYFRLFILKKNEQDLELSLASFSCLAPTQESFQK